MQAVRRGLRATVSLGGVPVEADVLAIDLDTREGTAADARERTREAVRDAGLLYVKLDSRLRGHVGAAIEGALDGAGAECRRGARVPGSAAAPGARRLVRCLRGQTSHPVRTGPDLETRASWRSKRSTTRTWRGSRPPGAGAGWCGPARRGWPARCSRACPRAAASRARRAVPGQAVLAVVGSPAASDQLDGLLARSGCFGITVDPADPARAGEDARAVLGQGGDAVCTRRRARTRTRRDLGGARPRRRSSARARSRPAADRRRDRARGVRPCGPDLHRPDRRSRAGRAARAQRASRPGDRHEVGRLRWARHARRRPRRHQGALRMPIAITMGDAAGIGPEIIVGALARRRRVLPAAVVIGDAERLRRAAAVLGVDVDIVAVARPGRRGAGAARSTASTSAWIPADLPFGELSAQAGEAAYQYDRARGRARPGGRRRRHLHGAAQQGGAARRRAPLPRPHRAARRADRRRGLRDDADHAEAARHPRHDAHRPDRRGRRASTPASSSATIRRGHDALCAPGRAPAHRASAASTRTRARTACSATARRRTKIAPASPRLRADGIDAAGPARRPTPPSSAPCAATSTSSSRCTTTRATARSRCSASRRASTSPSACRSSAPPSTTAPRSTSRAGRGRPGSMRAALREAVRLAGARA